MVLQAGRALGAFALGRDRIDQIGDLRQPVGAVDRDGRLLEIGIEALEGVDLIDRLDVVLQLRRPDRHRLIELPDRSVGDDVGIGVHRMAGIPERVFDQAETLEPRDVELPDLRPRRGNSVRGSGSSSEKFRWGICVSLIDRALEYRLQPIGVGDIGRQLDMQHFLVDDRQDELERLLALILDGIGRRHVVRDGPEFEIDSRLQMLLQLFQCPLRFR